MFIDYILYFVYFITIFISLMYIIIYAKNKEKIIKKPSGNQPDFTVLIL